MPFAFLTEASRDVIAITGVVGVIVTIIALGIGIWQLYRTTTANKAATEAAVESLNESKERYDRYVIGQVNRFFSEARLCVKNEEWDVAALRLDDIADLISQFADIDLEWGSLAEDLRAFSEQFRRIGAAEIQFKRLQSKWRNLQNLLSRRISLHHGPFQAVQRDGNTDRG